MSHGSPETAWLAEDTFWWVSITGNRRSPDQCKPPRVRSREQEEATVQRSPWRKWSRGLEPHQGHAVAGDWGPSLNSRVAVLNGHPGHPFWKEGATFPTPVFSQEASDQIPGARGEGWGRRQLPAEGGQGRTSRQQAGWGLAGSGASCSNGSQIPQFCVKKCVHGVGSQARP